MSQALTTIVATSNRQCAGLIEGELRNLGGYDMQLLPEPKMLARQVQLSAPDVVLLHAETASREQLENLAQAAGARHRPVVLFVDQSQDGLPALAIEAGISAYVVDGLQPARLKPILEATLARFQLFQRLRTEHAEALRALEERKIIDRAKGMVMRSRNIGEDEAYTLLRKAAMDQNKRVAEVAKALVTTAGLLA